MKVFFKLKLNIIFYSGLKKKGISKDMAIRRRLLLTFSFISLVCFIISTYGPVWHKNSVNSYGLWKMCTLATGICRPLDDIGAVSTKHEVIQAFAVIATLMAGFGVFTAFLSFKTEEVTGLISAVFLLACMVSSMISQAVYIDQYGKMIKNTMNVEYGWSFVLAWFGTGCSFMAVVVGLLTLYEVQK